jgi:dTDP-4-dehydrorhamnose reductase
MLGTQLAKHFEGQAETISGIDVTDWTKLEPALEKSKADVVLNAIGFIKQRKTQNATVTQIEVNALFPHRLAQFCEESNRQLIHFSTDCVFSGRTGQYDENSITDPVDVYGQTKALGEVTGPNILTLRTSFIGLQTTRKDSLVEWFLSQTGPVLGYKKAIYSGLTTYELARVVARVLSKKPAASGLYHVSAAPISKYELLCSLRDKLGLKTNIHADETFVCDRSMRSERFQADFDYSPPSWDDMLNELAFEIKKRSTYV